MEGEINPRFIRAASEKVEKPKHSKTKTRKAKKSKKSRKLENSAGEERCDRTAKRVYRIKYYQK
jgi:hypothetical protein